MDGISFEIPLFLFATFGGAFVAGLSGFAFGLVAASIWLTGARVIISSLSRASFGISRVQVTPVAVFISIFPPAFAAISADWAPS